MNYPREVVRSVEEAHFKKEYRPVVVMIIQDALGRVLFVCSTKNKNEWYLPQGGIDENELAIEALFRETEEELGIPRKELGTPHYLGEEDLDAEKTRADKRGFSKGKRYFFFKLSYVGPSRQFELNRKEIGGYEWVARGDIVQILFTTRSEKRSLIVKWLEKL